MYRPLAESGSPCLARKGDYHRRGIPNCEGPEHPGCDQPSGEAQHYAVGVRLAGNCLLSWEMSGNGSILCHVSTRWSVTLNDAVTRYIKQRLTAFEIIVQRSPCQDERPRLSCLRARTCTC